jgi:hypothetical protein
MARSLFMILLVLSISGTAWAGPLRFAVALLWEQQGETRALSGWLGLELPIERLAQPRAAPRAIAERPPEPKREGGEAEPAPETAEPAPRAQRAIEPALPLLRVAPGFAREIVREALRLQGDAKARERLDGLSGRARVSAILPELTLRAARSTDQSLRVAPAGVDRYDLTQTGGADLLFEARATWELDRLVFADEELRVEQLRHAREAAAERLVLLVLKHLFAWQRARAALLAPDLDPERAWSLEIDAFEAEAALDVLTDGYFGRRLGERLKVAGHSHKKE